MSARATRAERKTRSGATFNPWTIEFREDAIVVPRQRIQKIARRRAQQCEDDSDEDTAFIPMGFPGSGRSQTYKTKADLAALVPLQHSTSSPIPPSTSASPTPSETAAVPSRMKRKRECYRLNRAVRRREDQAKLQADADAPLRPIHARRVAETPALHVDGFSARAHTEPVASSGWMGLQDHHILARREREKAAALDDGTRAEDADDESGECQDGEMDGNESDDMSMDSDDEFVPEDREYALDDPVLRHFRQFNWLGNPMRLEDDDGSSFGMLVGAPNDPTWTSRVADPATAFMENAAAGLYGQADAAPPTHRRGTHFAETVGVGMGGGRREPSAFFHQLPTELLLWTLMLEQPFQRILGHSDAVYKGHAPGLYRYYKKTNDAIHRWANKRRKHLPRIHNSVLASFTFNFGPQTMTRPHIDFANLAWGWCFVTALGHYHPDYGGHLILWDLKLIIRFPPGQHATPTRRSKVSDSRMEHGCGRGLAVQSIRGATLASLEADIGRTIYVYPVDAF
ncbi:hypothetical protein MKEN_00982700 [Mycena kentingensis (nom. inval.)]|nr:hypothetical protein MKEN_00982700 [Mycena kentingensis (nom. inval.)]